jgi:hypothetical protein
MASQNIKGVLQRKMLQIDVTFGTYLFSPIEKFAYCMLFSLPIIASLFLRSLSSTIPLSRAPLLGMKHVE